MRVFPPPLRYSLPVVVLFFGAVRLTVNHFAFQRFDQKVESYREALKDTQTTIGNRSFEEAYDELLNSQWLKVVFIAAECLAITWLLQVLVTRRVRQIISATESLATGKDEPAMLQGSDELAAISSSLHQTRQQLTLAQQKIEEMQRQVIDISEQEQRRIGHDLHDDLCQRLAAIRMKLQGLGESLAEQVPETAQEVEKLAKHVAEATKVSRALAQGMAPVAVGAEGLDAALSGLARNAEAIYQVACHYSGDPQASGLTQHQAIQVYRISQEAIANAVKHGQAEAIFLTLRCPENAVQVTVENNGSPFPDSPSRSGLGLHLMKLRASNIGAKLEFIKNPTKSATLAVRCTVPLPSPQFTNAHTA